MVSCGGSDSPVEPGQPQENISSPESDHTLLFSPEMTSGGRYLFGYWELIFDFGNGTAEAIPLRFTEQHVNVRQFLEEAPCFMCLRLTNFAPQPDDTFFIDVEFEHPFAGLDNLTGFDVRGIAIFNGSYVFPSSGLIMSDNTLNEMELLNADGYTTLFNPIDFPQGTGPPIFTYTKGKAATPLSNPATLNGYKAFWPDAERRMFPAGGVDQQNYHIARPAGSLLRVGYAVDASWEPPITQPVENPLIDFGPNANCYEAYDISVSIGTGLMPGCGSAPYEIDVYDHQGHATVGDLILEAPDLFTGMLLNDAGVDMGDFTRFSGHIPNELKVGVGDYRVLIGVFDITPDPVFGTVIAWTITTANVEWVEIDFEQGWRKDGRTLGNTAFDPNETVLGANLVEAWTYSFPGGIYTNFESTPIIHNDLVFVKADYQSDHKIFALSIFDGSVQWNVSTQPYFDPYAYHVIPLVGNCELYVGGSSVHAYDLVDQTDFWSYGIPSIKFQSGSPSVSEGVLVIWGNNQRLYAFDAANGDSLWDYSTGEATADPGTPAIDDGVVYAGDFAGYAFALDLQTGEEIWQVQFTEGGPSSSNKITAPPVLAGGLVWFGSWNCHLYGLDLSDGSTVWDVDLNDQLPVAAPAFDGTYLYQPTGYSSGTYTPPFRVVAIDPVDGSIEWEHDGTAGEAFQSQPAVANNVLWFVSDAGNLYHLDPSSGSSVGPATYTLEAGSYNGPTIAYGMLFIQDIAGKVYAYGPG